MLQGCALFFPETTAKVLAAPHAKPVVTAIENYRKENSEYPQALANLYPKYLATNVPLVSIDLSKSNQGSRYTNWSISYQRLSPTNYQLEWYGGLSRAVYENGRLPQYDSPGVGH